MHYVKQLIVVSLILSTLSACRTTKQVSGTTDLDQPVTTAAVEKPGPQISSPRHTLAVVQFNVIGSFSAHSGGTDIGRELAVMLTSALVDTNQFIVLERERVDKILREHQITGEALSLKGTGPKLGRLLGVDYLVFGSVTQFSTDEKGGGVSLGYSGGEISKLINAAISRQASSGSVGMEIHLVDATTSEVVRKFTVKEKITSSAFDIVGGFKGFNLGKNRFRKTPLGEAARKAIDQAINEIVTEAKSQPWTGRVVHVSGNQIRINVGSLSGIQGGEEFMIKRVVETFTDPQTGLPLGTQDVDLGILKVEKVEDKLSVGNFLPTGYDEPQRGDLVMSVMK